MNSKNVLQSWHHFVRHVVIFPDQCSICMNGQWEWPEDPLRYFGSLVENIRAATNEDSPMKAVSPARKKSRKRWSESETDDEDGAIYWANMFRAPGVARTAEDASSVPLRAAGAGRESSSGVSLRTAGAEQQSAARQSDVPLRAILKRNNATRAGPRKSVQFGENTNDPEPTKRASELVFWHLRVCLERKVVLSFGVSHLTETEAEKNCLLRQAQSKRGPFYLLTDVESSLLPPPEIQFAEQLVAESELLQKELESLWVVAQNANIPIEQQDMENRLQEIELFLFLHMVSILMDCDTLPFTVSCYFLSYVGQHFRYHLHIDIMELMARFVYYVWLSPAMDAITWNSWPALLFPGNCNRIESWWEKLQIEFRVDSDECFCEEYWCVRERVQRLLKSDSTSGVPLRAADAGSSGSAGTSGVLLRAAGGRVERKEEEKKKLPCLEEELEQIKYRFVQSPIRIVPKMPDLARWVYHDAAVPAESALPAHRVLQPMRPSGGKLTAAWGNNDGNQIQVSLANLISEPHVFLKVPKANISYDLTLEELMGPSFSKLAEVFLTAQLPLPWWMPKEWLKGVALRPAWVPELDHESFSYYSSLQYQMLGGLVFSSVRPDCVFHPHLRCHMEYHCGRLLAFLKFFKDVLEPQGSSILW